MIVGDAGGVFRFVTFCFFVGSRVAGGEWWVVRFDGRCPGLKKEGYGVGGVERGKDGTD